MKVLTYAYGSRGDVEPSVALSLELQQAGHHVTVAAPAQMEEWITSMDVTFRPLSDSTLQSINDPEFRDMFERLDGPPRGELRERSRRYMDEALDEYPDVLKDIAGAAHGDEDVVLFTQGLGEATRQMAERLGALPVLTTVYPNYAAGWRYPSMLLAGLGVSTPRWVNRLSHVASHLIPPPSAFRSELNQWRHGQLGLKPRARPWDFRPSRHGEVAVAHCFSRHVLQPDPSWGPSTITCGYWFMPSCNDKLPGPLERFLAEGDPPIAISLGSLAPTRVEERLQMMVGAIVEGGYRALIVGSATEFDGSHRDLATTKPIPFEHLMPRLAAIIHSGGTGTMHHALRAGLPQIIVPVQPEQSMWGNLAHRLGVAPKPMRSRDVSASWMLTAVQSLGAHEDAARLMRDRVRSEPGAAKVAQWLERRVAVAGGSS